MAYSATAEDLQIGEFLVVAADRAPGFWIGRVAGFADQDDNGTKYDTTRVRVHWWDGGGVSGYGGYIECNKHGVPYITVLDTKCIMYIFNDLTPTSRRLPRQIARAIQKD